MSDRTPSESIQAAYEKATPGEWKLWGMDVLADPKDIGDVAHCIPVADTHCRNAEGKARTFDADFIIAAHNHWPAVAASLAQLSRDLDAALAENARMAAALGRVARQTRDGVWVVAGDTVYVGGKPCAFEVSEDLDVAVEIGDGYLSASECYSTREAAAAALSSPPQAAGGATT